MYLQYNPNPDASRVGDCAIRMLCRLTGEPWEDCYINACIYGLLMHDLPSSNVVWGKYLNDKGYGRRNLPQDREIGYSVRDFCQEHPEGSYALALPGHVVAVVDGHYYDTWDSGDEHPLYYWEEVK